MAQVVAEAGHLHHVGVLLHHGMHYTLGHLACPKLLTEFPSQVHHAKAVLEPGIVVVY